MLARLGVSESAVQSWIRVFAAADFMWGFLLVFTYAAIRPRFGPGPKTAIISWHHAVAGIRDRGADLMAIGLHTLESYRKSSALYPYPRSSRAGRRGTVKRVVTVSARGLTGVAVGAAPRRSTRRRTLPARPLGKPVNQPSPRLRRSAKALATAERPSASPGIWANSLRSDSATSPPPGLCRWTERLASNALLGEPFGEVAAYRRLRDARRRTAAPSDSRGGAQPSRTATRRAARRPLLVSSGRCRGRWGQSSSVGAPAGTAWPQRAFESRRRGCRRTAARGTGAVRARNHRDRGASASSRSASDGRRPFDRRETANLAGEPFPARQRNGRSHQREQRDVLIERFQDSASLGGRPVAQAA